MSFFAGIDGGQSTTTAVIGDQHGRILSRGTAGPADEIGQSKESTRLRDALHGALENARRNAGLASSTRFEAIVAGVSGYQERVYGRQPELPSACVRLVHDTPIAHAGALGGRTGVIIIAGTGSVVYGRNDAGWSCTLGGWGYLFGDEGSAFAIVRDALAMLMRAQDEGDHSLEPQVRAVCEYFGTNSLRRLAHAFYKGNLTRDRLAGFAPTALCFEAFRSDANRGADRLATLAAAAIDAGAPPRVAFVGGVFADTGMRERVRGGILRRFPQAEIVESRYDPACGALLLAYRERGLGIAELAQ
jgi:N-acetylglucosamine kinase-like BadF-type ATPase